MSYSFDPTLFHNKYRIPSARWQGWDCGSSGWYFVTICTKDMEHYLGDIIGNRMRLSLMGRLIKQCWQKIPNHFPHITLDAFVIMPNHVHGIVAIQNRGVMGRDEACLVSTGYRISPASGSLSAIIGAYKSSCTKIIHEHYPYEPFAWQPRYHDRVIRTGDELERIRWYIHNNPRMWIRDRNRH
jgi:putative transposase